MKTRCLPLTAALLLAVSAFQASAQASAPPPLSAASAPPAAAPGPRVPTSAESREGASPPGELRPEHPVTPQVNIQLGRTPPTPLKSAPRAGNAASGSRIDDAAARCEAQLGEQVRAKCRDELAHQARTR